MKRETLIQSPGVVPPPPVGPSEPEAGVQEGQQLGRQGAQQQEDAQPGAASERTLYIWVMKKELNNLEDAANVKTDPRPHAHNKIF